VSNVFVSYSRHDRRAHPIVDRLLTDLRAAGISLWLVPDDVPPGVDWQYAKPDGLAASDAMLFLFGRSLSKTRMIQDEIEQARARGLPVVVAVITETASRLLPQYTTFFEGMTVSSVVPQDAEEDDAYAAGLAALIAALPASVHGPVLRSATAQSAEPRSKGYVFISYAQEDTPFVEQLRAFLGEKGYGYWDYQASDRNFHTQLFLELEEVIKNASATLSVLSPDWKKSKWAAKEYLFSEEVNVPVFLLMAREMGPTLVTAGVTYIDFTADPASGFARLDRELRRKGLI
jgi:hypothetical protein